MKTYKHLQVVLIGLLIIFSFIAYDNGIGIISTLLILVIIELENIGRKL